MLRSFSGVTPLAREAVAMGGLSEPGRSEWGQAATKSTAA
jgi:hypothetical protein